MAVKLSDFATGQTVRETDHVVGYADTNTGGERKWTLANLRDSLITGAATTIDTDNLAANRVLISDASGKVGVSTLASNAIGTVTSVTGTAPISVATGTTTPAISISEATQSAAGAMSSTDKTRLNSASGVDGIVKCNGNGVFSPAVAGTDYFRPMTYLASQNANGLNTVSFTGIPSGVNRITIMCTGLIFNANGNLVKVQIGTSDSIEKSGYTSTLQHTRRSDTPTTTYNTTFYRTEVGFGVSQVTTFTPIVLGNIDSVLDANITLTRAGGNVWTAETHFHLLRYNGSTHESSAGRGFGVKTLTGNLSQLRVITGLGGAATDGDIQFTGGAIYVMYE